MQDVGGKRNTGMRYMREVDSAGLVAAIGRTRNGFGFVTYPPRCWMSRKTGKGRECTWGRLGKEENTRRNAKNNVPEGVGISKR